MLSIAAGGSCYQPETDKSFQNVFVRADVSMYQKKEEYHRRNGSVRTYLEPDEEESGE